MFLRIFVFYLALSTLSTGLYAQKKSSQKVLHFTANNGLPNGKIHAISQDAKGFVWIGTENGLVRFDGKQSKFFYNNELQGSYGIAHNYVYSVATSSDNKVWVGTMNGLNAYNHVTGEFSHKVFYDANKNFVIKPVWHAIARNNGECILRTDTKDLYIATERSDSLKKMQLKNYISRSILTALEPFNDEYVIVGEKNGMLYLVNMHGNVIPIDTLPNSITSIKKISQNVVCVGTNAGNMYIYENNIKTKIYSFPIKNIPISEKYISAIEVLHDSTVVVGTRGAGLFKLDIFKGWQPQNSITDLLINPHIEVLFRDRFNNIWIGHSYGGVSVWLYNYQIFDMLDCPEYVNQHKILSLASHKQHLYIGTDGGGLFIYDTKTKHTQHYNFEKPLKTVPFDNVVTSMHADSTHMWISTYNKGLYAIDLQTQNPSFVNDLQQISKFEISNVYANSRNQVWIGTYEYGVYVYNKKLRKITNHYSTDTFDPTTSISCNGTTCFFEDSKQNMWLGSYYGVSKVDTFGKVSNYTYNTHKGLKNNLITTFYEDANGLLWIGSAQGLSFYDEQKDTIIAFPSGHSMNKGSVYGILQPYRTTMWFVTPYSLFIYNTQTQIMGYVGNSNLGEFSREAFTIDKSNMYIGTEKGILYFNYTKPLEVKHKEIIQLSDLWVHGKSVFSYDSPYKMSFENDVFRLQLPSHEENITLFFSDFLLETRSGVEYVYKLDNYIDEWTPLHDVNFVNFAKLQGGDYVFRVKKQGDDASESAELVVYISIKKAIWEYWFFYVIIGLILLVIVYVIYNYRVNRIISNKNQLQLQVNQRIQELHLKTSEIEHYQQTIDAQQHFVENQQHELERQKDEFVQEQEELKQIIKEKNDIISLVEMERDSIRDEKAVLQRNIQLIENYTQEMVFRIKLPSEEFDYVSPAVEQLTGYSAQEFYDDSMIFRRLIVSEGKDDFKKFRKYMIEGKVPPAMEYKIVTKQGKEKWVLQECTIIRADDNHPIAFEAVLSDISHKKELEYKTNAAKGRAKLLKTKLPDEGMSSSKYAIKTFTELLNQDDLSLDEKQPFIETNFESSTYALQLIEDYIDISKIQAGKLHLNYSQCYVHTILQELLESFEVSKNMMHKKQVSLDLLLPSEEEHFSFYTDTYRFRQVMMNLIGNALKYTKRGSVEFGYEIVHKSEAESNMELVFFVKDTGVGISADKLTDLFDNRHFNDSSEYTGVGLAVSKRLVELMGGTMWVESELNMGSTFKFSLPLQKMKGLKKNDIIAKSDSPLKNWSNKTLLLAEDEQNNYDFVCAALKKTNIQVIWVTNGEQALRVYKEQMRDIDVILMDIQMPVMNGYEATQKIKEIDRDVPIIAQTAYANYEAKLNCFDAGCDNYIAKPYKSKDLIELLSKYL